MEKARKIPYYGSLILLAYMPFHIFLSRWLSLYTGGLSTWSFGKDFLTLALLVVSIALFIKFDAYKNKVLSAIFYGSAAYALLHFAFLIFDESYDIQTALVATLYNGRLFAYLFIASIGAWLHKDKFKDKFLIRLVVVVALVTAVIGVAQYFLPSDLMTNFGYSVERGVKPAFFIDDKPDLPRIMSTVRDPNSYGAYLIVPVLVGIALLSRRFTVGMRERTVLAFSVFFLAATFLTFSRSAWLSLALAVTIYTFITFRPHFKHRYVKIFGIAAIVLALSTLIALYAARDSYLVENVITHGDEQTRAEDPNELRVRYQSEAAEDIVGNPIGHGPGTAGIVSISNPNGGILTENYYLQIGYEVGVIGLALFVGLQFYICYVLFKAGKSNPLSNILLAAFCGYVLSSMLNHLWSNEAVAAQWWILAGMVIGLYSKDKLEAKA